MAYSLVTQSFGSRNANAKVTITENITGEPATILSSPVGGVVNTLGQANLDDNGDLSVYLDTSRNWIITVFDGSNILEVGSVIVVDIYQFILSQGGQGEPGRVGVVYQDRLTGDFYKWNPILLMMEQLSAMPTGGQGVVLSVAGKIGNVLLNKNDVGLGSVDNTADAFKPVSAAQALAIAAAAASGPVMSVSGKTGDVILVKSDLGLGNVDNTSDLNKPVSTAQAAAIAAAMASGPVTSVAGKTGAVTLVRSDVGLSNVDNTSDENKPVSTAQAAAIAVAASSGPVSSVAGKTGVVTLTKADVGLSNVDNTSDASKPISSAQAIAIAAAAASGPVTSVAGKAGAVTLNKNDVGLSNVDNTSDANKPVSTAANSLINDVKSIALISVSAANDFRNSGLRGMHTDDIIADNPRSADYMKLFARSRSNVTRRFIKPLASGLGQPYVVSPGIYSTLATDLAAFAAVGCRTVLVINPQRTGVPDEATNTEFWASSAAQAAHVAICAEVALAVKGDPRIAGIAFLNEPFDTTSPASQAFTNKILTHQENCIDAVRAVDPTRTCVVTCAWYGAPGGYTQMRPVRQDNVVYEFHWYQPFEITHANVGGMAAYSGTYPSTQTLPVETGSGAGIAEPLLADKYRMKAVDMHPVIAFYEQYNVPIFVGEFTCSRLNRAGVANRWIQDSIDIFQELGFSWCHFGFWFPPLPWNCFELDSSTADINYNSGAGPDTDPQASFTFGSTSGRTPFAVVSGALEKNALYKGSNRVTRAGLSIVESFEGNATRLGFSLGADPGTTIVTNSTANPKSGTRHARFTHVSGAGPKNCRIFLTDNGAGKDFDEYFLSADICLGTAITAGGSITLFELSSFGGGSNNYYKLRNVPGTNTWQVEIWKGSGDYGTRPFINVDDMVLPVGQYTNIKISWLRDVVNGRIRVWQDKKLLVDINHVATSTNPTDSVWNPFYGLSDSTQIGMFIDYDNIVFSGGADIT